MKERFFRNRTAVFLSLIHIYTHRHNAGVHGVFQNVLDQNRLLRQPAYIGIEDVYKRQLLGPAGNMV